MFHESLPLSTRLPGLALLVLGLSTAAAACAESTAADEERLSSLSIGQLRALCRELGDTWAGESGQLSCDNGKTLYVDQAGIAACGTASTECSATAGQWRACMSALFDDSCQAALQEPEACTALLAAPGCAALALPVQARCTPPSVDYLVAYEGIYEVIEHTRNAAGCELEGAAIEASGSFALAVVSMPDLSPPPLANWPVLALQACSSPDECRQRMDEILGMPEPYLWLREGPNNADIPGAFECGLDRSSALPAVRVDSMSSPGDVAPPCTLIKREASLRRAPDGSVTLELRTFEPSPAADENDCFPGAAAAPESRCAQLDVLRSRRVASL
jgi:hypothetical protein